MNCMLFIGYFPISSVFKRKIDKMKNFQSVMKMHNKFYSLYNTIYYFIYAVY